MKFEVMLDNGIKSKYLKHMKLGGFTQAVFDPTRFCGNTKTIVDHVFPNKIIQSPVIDLTDLCITDHLATFEELPWVLKPTLTTQSIGTKTFLLNTENKQVFLEDMKNRHTFLNSGLNSLGEQFSAVGDCLKRKIDDYKFLRPSSRRSSRTVWYINRIRSLNTRKKNKVFQNIY